MLELVIAVTAGVLTGAVAVLAVVHTRTKTTVDDKAYALAKKLLELAESLKK